MVKTAIVIEASRGIGRSIAKRLAEDGFAVVVNYSTDAHEARETVAEIAESGGQAVALQADLNRQEELKQLFDGSLKEFGRIDVVVSNVGVMDSSPISRGDVEAFDEMIRTNLRGAFLLFVQAASHIVDGGRIIAFSSDGVGTAPAEYGAYVASKAGVEGLVRVLAKELRKRHVSVNAVALGSAATDHYVPAKGREEAAPAGDVSPSEEIGETHDILHVVSFLAGPDGGWATGQVIPVTGGRQERTEAMPAGVCSVRAGEGKGATHVHAR